jgi:hypothetical protein
MKIFHVLLAVLSVASCVALRADDAKPAPPRVDVVYVNPEKFTDVKNSYVGSDEVRDEYLGMLKEHIETHADKYIPAGQHLALRITDVKMAGDFEPWRGPSFDDIRIIKDIYPPRINLEFKLTDANGKTLKEGGRHLIDTNFMSPRNFYFPDDALRYEKQMLDDWFRNEFGHAKN